MTESAREAARAEFESSVNFVGYTFTRDCNGDYTDSTTYHAWLGWIAAIDRHFPGYHQERVQELEAVIERDRTRICDGINNLRKVIEGRDWLGEGRGPYEWDDDRWHDEFKATASEIRQALEPLTAIARDLSNCPQTWEAVQWRGLSVCRKCKAVLRRISLRE